MSAKIDLKRTAIAVTQRCTLKCKRCNAYMPHYNEPKDMPLDDVVKVLRRYFSIVGRVGIFGILGGEPLMHRDIAKILNEINKYTDQITDRIDLVTNGTLDINNDTLNFFIENAPKTKLVISHYGELSKKADFLSGKLTANGVNFRIAKYYGDDLLYDGWIDYSDHSQKHFTPEEIDNQARDCIVRREQYYLISEGQMHTCTRAHWRIRSGIIPHNKEEYLDLTNDSISIDEQKSILMKMNNKTATTSCAYCKGASDEIERFTPAEQL